MKDPKARGDPTAQYVLEGLLLSHTKKSFRKLHLRKKIRSGMGSRRNGKEEFTKNQRFLFQLRRGAFTAVRASSSSSTIYAFGGTACLPHSCLLYTSPSPRDRQKSRMPSSA